MSESAALQIVEKLNAAGYQALYAGGAVRDELLGRPAADYDVTTDAHPDVVMQLFPKHTAVGAHFGVVLVHLDGSHIEVATFRTDAAYRDGRHPDHVEYATDAKEDVLRRDFTINGLLKNPLTGEVLDYVGGRSDLEAGVVRTIGDPERRFGEDRLRMLRAVRFAARLGFRLDPATKEAIRRQASEIHQISQERIRDEMVKMLTEGQARRAFELLDETGLLRPILPEVADMKGVEQPPQFHPEGDVWTHTLMMIGALPAGVSKTLALGVLLHDVGKPPTFRRAPDRIRFDNHAFIGARMTERIGQRLRLSREETEQVVALVDNHMRFMDAPRMRESTLKRFLRLERFADEHLELHRLDCTMSHGDLSTWEMVKQKLAEMPEESIRPPRLLTGQDLIRMGMTPSPRFREILTAVEDAQLEGRLHTTEEARTFVEQSFGIG